MLSGTSFAGYLGKLKSKKIIERANSETVVHFIRVLTLVIIIIEKPIKKLYLQFNRETRK